MINDGRNSDQEFQVLTQVLDAEKSAHKRLEDARMEAESILQEAHNTARSIEAKADTRIQNLHDQFRKKLAQNKQNQEDVFKRGQSANGKTIDSDKVKDVTKRLARQIVGAAKK